MVKYSFKIDFHILKGLKTSLEVKILKNDKNCQIRLTACGHTVDQKWQSTDFLELFELPKSTVITNSNG